MLNATDESFKGLIQAENAKTERGCRLKIYIIAEGKC
jgi:hypothetical protein